MSFISSDSDAIIAQCTPTGSGALALLRITGDQAVTIVTAMSRLASGKKLSDLPTHTIHYGSLVDKNSALIDRVLFFLMRGPHTFTGQDTVEISCHNNPFIIAAIIEHALQGGARLAQEGEFTRRAVLNGKIDLVQAEAIHELIHANTHQALKKSLAQLEGTFSHWITQLEKELLAALAFCQASFEFIDEEMEFGDRIAEYVTHVLATIRTLHKNFDQQVHIRQGVRVALIGSVNVGKSSLFNALLDKKRAIVTAIAGTTRDVIEAGVYKKSSYWTLVDTAGLRETQDSIEQEGIARSLQEAHQADVILLVADGMRAMQAQEHEDYQNILERYRNKIIVVYNKCDAGSPEHVWLQHDNVIHISTVTHFNRQALEAAIEQKIENLFAAADAPFLLNRRQYALLLTLEKKLNALVPQLVPPVAYELVACHLQDALAHVSELTGKSISEQAMDAVFREFCVGK